MEIKWKGGVNNPESRRMRRECLQIRDIIFQIFEIQYATTGRSEVQWWKLQKMNEGCKRNSWTVSLPPKPPLIDKEQREAFLEIKGTTAKITQYFSQKTKPRNLLEQSKRTEHWTKAEEIRELEDKFKRSNVLLMEVPERKQEKSGEEIIKERLPEIFT